VRAARMTTEQLLFAAAVLMAVTAVAIGLAKRLNLGSIAALLAVGMVLGPHSPLPLFTAHVADLQSVGEIGVMLLIFVVGLETQPSRLWSMRTLVFGFGSLEYLAASGAIAGFVLVVSSVNWQSALVIGMGLAMSSSAVPLPILQARHEATSPHGRLTVAAGIFQDLMVIPVLALIPLLGNSRTAGSDGTDAAGLLHVAASLIGVFLLGRVMLPYALARIARDVGSGALSLVVLAGVFAAAWIVEKAGISMALGAFMMGVLLSTSVFSDQVKAAVTPARQVLLGVFFVAVGMAIDVREAAAFGGELPFYVSAVLLIKFAVAYSIARAFGVDSRPALLGGLLLMPLDEIAYVIFASARAHGLLSTRSHALALLSISFSFLVAPIAINLGFRLAARLPERHPPAPAPPTGGPSAQDRVVVVGYGYIGRAMCTLLQLARADYVCFETDLGRLADGRSRNHVVQYGDFTDHELIGAVGIEQARLVVIAHEAFSVAKEIFAAVRECAPDVAVMTAVQYLAERDELRRLGAIRVTALAPEGTVSFGRVVLDFIAVDADRVDAIIAAAKADDYAVLREAIPR
jgi:glutathione-regulated potassium-efflux system ancillary protein KefC